MVGVGNIVSVGGGGGVSGGGTACFATTFTSATSVTVSHSLGTTDVVVNVFDDSDNKMLPDRIGIIDADTVVLEFNTPQTGKVVVVSCGGTNTNLEEAKRYALLVS